MISDKTRQIVRQKANFACEYCGVSETDAGGELTIDHFKPQSKSGSDEPKNLVYACSRCNLYKGDYFSETDSDKKIFNPRSDSSENHFIFLANGQVQPLTETGKFTIVRLRLNRESLVENRRQKQIQTEENLRIVRFQTLVELLLRLSQQQTEMLEEQQKLLERQQKLLEILFNAKIK